MSKAEPSEVLSQIHSYGLNPETREIYLHSHYAGDEEPGVEYRMATAFVKNLHFLERAAPRRNVLVHMHTVGGEWADGMAIYDAIKSSTCPVTILAHAQASSMSGIILQSAAKRVMMPSCEFLMHYGSISLDSHSLAARSVILWNDALHKRMLRIFAERAKASEKYSDLSVDQIEREFDLRMKEDVDWFLSAEETVRHGLADGVFGTKGFETTAKIRR